MRGGSDDLDGRNNFKALEAEIRADEELQGFLRLFLSRQSLDEQAQSMERILEKGLPVISQSPPPILDYPRAHGPDVDIEPPQGRTKIGVDDSIESTPPQGPPFEEALLFVPEHFIDREDDLAWVKSRLARRDTAGIAALRGMGGIGKSSLAAQAARELRAEGEYPDGIVVVLCRAKSQPTEVLREVLKRFDPYRRGPRGAALSESNLEDFAQQILTDKQALVIFDDVEPGLDMTSVLRPLRKLGISVLITSRQALSSAVVPVDGSRELELLSSEKALSVLIDAYMQHRTVELSSAQKAAARQIVEQLGHHTLALRLAGSYAANTGRDLEALAISLENPASALGLSDAEQQGAITALFKQSTNALPAPALRLFIALSAFGGDEFGRNAAIALAQALDVDSPAYTIDLLVLRALLDSSRSAPPVGDKTRDYERLHLHPLLHAFAYAEFIKQEKDDQRRAYSAIARYYAAYVQRASIAALDADQANIYAAIRWAFEQQEWALVVDLCLHMRGFWREKWLAVDSVDLLEKGMEAATTLINQDPTTERERDHADLRLARARALRRLYRLDDAENTVDAELAYRRTIVDRDGEANALRLLGEIYQLRGKLQRAKDYYEESLHIWHDLRGGRRSEGAVLGYIGRIEHLRANYTAATDYFADSLKIAEEVQDRRGIGRVHSSLGQVELARGDMAIAQEEFKQALDILRREGDKYGESDALTGMGRLAIDHRKFEEAENYLRQSLKIDQEISDRAGEGVDRSLLAQVELERGHLEKARHEFEANVRLRREVRDARGEGVDLSFLGRIALEQGRLDEARIRFTEALKFAREVENIRGQGATLNQLGVVALLASDAVNARSYLAESLRIAQSMGLDTDIARSMLSLGRAAIVLDGDQQTGCRYVSEAIRINTDRGRTLDLERAQTFARSLGCSSASE
jgi:tetratricopeptide (TPR) repeat protein